MDRLAKKIVNKIVRKIPVQKVFLFGSRATKKHKPDSDVDLLLIYDGPLSKREIDIQVRDLFLDNYDFGLDLFVLSSKEFESQKRVFSTLGQVVSEEGIICYDRERNSRISLDYSR